MRKRRSRLHPAYSDSSAQDQNDVTGASIVQQFWVHPIMPVSAEDSWVALSSTAGNPGLAYMVATLGVLRGPVERRCDQSRGKPGDGSE